MPKTIWVFVNSNNIKEARKIGRAVLEARLAACYSLVAKEESVYFWPPKSKRIESNKGPMIVFDTLPQKYQKIINLVTKLHSDRLPFIGRQEINGVTKQFFNWVKEEIK